MTIQQIKVAISAATGKPLPFLQFVTQLDAEKKPTEWVSHWDNINRIRVTMHQEVLQTVLATPEFNGLAYKVETVQPVPDPITKEEKSPYIRFILITPQNIVGTF